MMIGGRALLRHTPLMALGLTLLVGCSGEDPEPGSTGAAAPTERLIAVQAQLPALRQSLETLQADGVDIAYPVVRLTVLEEFSSILQDDLTAGGYGSTTRQIGELEHILDQVSEEIDGMEAGERLPDVPRYVTSPITIRDGAFWARVRWPDGTEQEDWPVIFNGYVAFDPIELLPAYGHNAVDAMIGPAWVLLSEEETDLAGADQVQDLLNRAAQADVVAALQLSPHFFPDWAYETWPDTRKPVLESKFGLLDEYIPFFVDSVEARALFERYLRAVIPELADHPALHSLILTNEPSYFNAILDPAIALNFSGEKIDYITEGQLAAGGAENYDLILAAGITHLPVEAADGLAAYAASGGRVVFVGESMAIRDEADRRLDNTFDGATLLPVLEPEELGELLRPMLADLPGGRSVVVKVADSGAEPWGVEWLHTRYDGRLLVNLTNYGKEAVTARIDGLPVEGRVDLLTMKPVGDVLTIEPLATHLIAAAAE